MGRYVGKEQHGKWWMHCNGTLIQMGDGITTTTEFNGNSTCVIKTWIVRCELDWYRMNKEYDQLRSELLPPIVA